MPLPSPELIAWWKPKLRALDPWRQLGFDEIEELYAERETAPFSKLASSLAVAEQPAEIKVILCGARGSGKSTELVRLAREVQDHFCVIEADLGRGLPEDGGTLAIVTILGVAALHAIARWSAPGEGGAEIATPAEVVPPSKGARQLESALKRFGEAVPAIAELVSGVGSVVTLFAPGTGAALKAAGVAGKAAGVGASKLSDALGRGPLGGRLKPEQIDDARAVVNAVNTILEELRELAGRPPLLLVDGLDKRTGFDDVELALSDEHLLRDLDAALILTGPVNLRHDPRFRAVPGGLRLSLLYNIPVRERDGQDRAVPGEAGVAVFRDLYARRQAGADLPEDMIATELVERAADLSSGIVRDFLRMLHAACENALEGGRRQVSEGDLDAAVKAQRLEMQGYLNQGLIETLGRVLDKGTVPAGEKADTLLFENFIACYPNGNLWYRPHELIVEFVQANAGRG